MRTHNEKGPPVEKAPRESALVNIHDSLLDALCSYPQPKPH